MPFTLCHPAIVLPLFRGMPRFTSLPGLVIGSMAPDFVYFLSLGISGSFTHSPTGILLYCVPAGLVVYLLYQLLIREPLLAWLPSAISTRIHRPAHLPLRSAASVAIVMGSLAVGATSHVFWDLFTHANTAVTNRYEIFRELAALGELRIPLFKILQQLSNLIGFIAIGGFFASWFRRTVPLEKYDGSLSRRNKIAAFSAVAITAAAGGLAGALLRQSKSVEHGLFNFVVSGMTSAALAILCLCLIWHVRARRNASPS